MLHMVRCISHRGEITEVQFLNTKQNGCCIIFLKQAEVTQGLETRKQFLLGWPWNYQVIVIVLISRYSCNLATPFQIAVVFPLKLLGVFWKHFVLECQV